MGSTPHHTASAGRPVVVRALVAAAASILLLAGCTTGGNMTNPGSTPTQPSASPSGSNSDVPPKRWAAIISDLTARGVPTDSVALVSARSVTWNDGSLGCPKPGQSYTQSLIPGMQVVVTVGAVSYDYRFGRTDNPVLCQR
jgi:hypothetical protein